MKPTRFAWLERIGPREWKFDFSREKWESDEDLDTAIDLMDHNHLARAESIFRRLIESYPYHFDAYHHLAILLGMKRKDEKAMDLRKKAVELGFSLFPKEFDISKHRLEWGWMENRPFLRAYEGLAIDYQYGGELRKALELYESIISLNPDDNQGCRCSAVWCCFELDEPDRVLKVCRRYWNDWMPEVAYGRALAFLQKGMREEARAALEGAVRDLPVVARELVREKHKEAKPATPGYVSAGGRDQAYAYWVDFGGYWKKTEGSIELVKECLKSRRKLSGGKKMD